MEWLLYAQYGSVWILGIFGSPAYITLGTIAWVYYNVINAIGIYDYIVVQWFGQPVGNNSTLESDLDEYTLGNYLDFPLRKVWIYQLLFSMGFMAATWPITNLVTVPVLGVAAYYNEHY